MSERAYPFPDDVTVVLHLCGHRHAWYIPPPGWREGYIAQKVCPTCLLQLLAARDRTIAAYFTQPPQPGTAETRWQVVFP